MSAIDADRPQDVGRPHRTRRRISERNRALLGAYHDTMRRELRELVNMLHERSQPLSERSKTWDLAIKLARELGSEIEEPRQLHPPSKAVDGPAEAANF